MTTIIPFTPTFIPGSAPWTNNVNLDGNPYTLTARWNVYSQLWYIELTALDGTLVFFKPLIGSPPGNTLVELTWETGSPSVTGSVASGSVTGSIVLPLPTESQSGLAIGSTASPQEVGVPVGGVVVYTIRNTRPAGYSGTFDCVVLDHQSFSYPLVKNPGTPASVAGSYSVDINLVEGYFSQSTLVYRPSSGLFEVNP